MVVRVILPFLLSVVLTNAYALGDDTVALEGTWRFQLDPDNIGVKQAWYTQKLEDTVQLPGTTDENRKGIQSDERREDRLTRKWTWKGPAWYQREVEIPEDWQGKHIQLLFERTKNSRVWVDDQFCGWEDTLSAFQVFDLTDALTPGKHTITVLIDNSRLPPVGPSHAVDERTQTNWNGIVGKMELRASDPVWLKDVQVYPDAANKQAKLRVIVGNITGKPFTGRLLVGCESYNVADPVTLANQSTNVKGTDQQTVVELVYQPGEIVPLWDEFSPALLRLNLTLETNAGDKAYRDEHEVCFGMRDFNRFRNRLLVNGREVFLRGRIDCCFYPITGYPPMDKEGWRKVLQVVKDWGLNHVRFHSWCPPEAAFAAADELGIYFQAEFPNKRSAFKAPEDGEAAIHNIDRLDVETSDTTTSLFDYGMRESELIFEHFGNHPSFAMYALGNEMGRTQGMYELVAHFQEIDPRHLYAQGSNNLHWRPSLAEGDDFWVIGALNSASGEKLPLRGSYYFNADIKGHIDNHPPSTLFNYSESISGVPVPLIAHEIGQFQVFPDFHEIPKFTGVLRPGNYELFRERLAQAGMLDQAKDFAKASGALAAICYREDIEAALRTSGLGGFQLLDIQDFGGQGTALVGLVDLFMESKGVIEIEKWREFCSETVPLLDMAKYTWQANEMYVGRVKVANYGASDLEAARVQWTIADEGGNSIASGEFEPRNLVHGKVSDIDMFAARLSDIATPQKLTITVRIADTSFRNEYPIWVYPPEAKTIIADSVRVARSFSDSDTQSHLASGGTVLLLPKLEELPRSVQGSYQCDFWSPMFAQGAKRRGLELPPGTLGILCDPQHPAFARFPTEFHSNWQWWHLAKNSRPIILDDTPDSYRPTVQVIDNIARCHKLGLVFETRVGKGKMLVCAIDLLGHKDKPAVRQMLQSLTNYVSSPEFEPDEALDGDLLEGLLP